MRRRYAVTIIASMIVSACGTSHVAGDDAGTPPDAVQFCRETNARICARNHAIDPDDAAFSACSSRIEADCASATWVAGCVPTREALDACLAALVDVDHLTIAPDALPECASICRDP